MIPGKWKKLLDRLSQMNRDELRFRARQEFSKRWDFLSYLLRVDFAKKALQSGIATRANFFFGPNDVGGRLDLLRQRLPDQVTRIVQQADRILDHRFDLLGYTGLAYGAPIDWHLDLVHGRRAERKIFYRVPFLDFDEVGDSKVIWELNRHQHFVTLAKAYRLTGNPRYADEILRQWRHWRAENPYPIGINWASSLEAAFRSIAWLWTYHILAGAPGVPDFRQEWLRVIALHGRHIEQYLSTYFSPNTHLLGEGVALFFLGVLCPELTSAERWKDQGWHIVLEEARRQVRPDGFHFEQSTYYHVYALDFFQHAAILASVNGISLPKEFEESLEKMLTSLCLLSRCGPPPRLGDDDGGRLFDPLRNHGEHLRNPLATGAILFHRGDYKAAAGGLCEETIWLLGPEGVRQWDELEGSPMSMNSSALEAAGLYFLASERPATQLVFDCGPLGAQSGGHGHADALNVTLQSRKHDLLIDPGTCEYIGEGGERNLFRGTAMHNTLRVDGLDQAEPATAFSWRRLTHSKAEKWIQGHDFDLVEGSHDGYQGLDQPVVHRRCVLSLKNGMYLVRDRIEGTGRHRLEISWHLGEELQMVEDGVFRVKNASQGLALIPAAGLEWAQQVSKQSWSPVYGRKAPMTVITFSKTTDVPQEFCILLVALEEASNLPGAFARVETQNRESGVSAYKYVGGNEERSFFFSAAKGVWQDGSAISDAEFVCWSRLENRAKRSLIFVNGSHVEAESGLALRFKRSVSWGEVLRDEGRREIFSSEPEAIDEAMAIAAPEASALMRPS
jgi:hypothetical protein